MRAGTGLGIRLSQSANDDLVALASEVERYIDDMRGQPQPLPAYTVAQLLLIDASKWTDCAVICSNEAGGRTIATSNGTVWARVKDGATVS